MQNQPVPNLRKLATSARYLRSVEQLAASLGLANSWRALILGQRVLAEFGVIRVEYGMLRIQCRSGGNHWIEIDSGRTYRGKTFLNAEELQPKFIDALEPDDNPRITKGNVRDCKPSTRGMSGVKRKAPPKRG